MEFALDLDAAQRLVREAQSEPDRLTRHLLLAAAITELVDPAPPIVGGTAEQYWARDEYVETDLDMCGELPPEAIRALRQLGFHRVGRYWELDGQHVLAMEFPEGTLAGDQARVVEDSIRGHRFRVIGIDDLYLDRLRQATAKPLADEDRLASAYALLATRAAIMDFRYIRSQIDREVNENKLLADLPYLHRQLTTGLRRDLRFPEVLSRVRAGLGRRRSGGLSS